MAHKTITISEEAYEMLSDLKKEGESFTEVIKRVVKEVKTRPLNSFSGSWKGDSEELNEIQKEIQNMWKGYERTLRRAE
jgi:predicted CopG family antitoxin